MPRFDVFENRHGAGLLIDVQSDLLQGLNTRVVVPLLPVSAAPVPAKRLNPVFSVLDADYVLVTQLLATIPLKELPARVANLAAQRQTVSDALDMLFSGY